MATKYEQPPLFKNTQRHQSLRKDNRMPSSKITIHQNSTAIRGVLASELFRADLGKVSKFDRLQGKGPLFLVETLDNSTFHATTSLNHFKLSVALKEVPNEGIQYISSRSVHKIEIPDSFKKANGLIHINFSDNINKNINFRTVLDISNRTESSTKSATRFECQTVTHNLSRKDDDEDKEKPTYHHIIQPIILNTNEPKKQVSFNDIPDFKNHRIVKQSVIELINSHTTNNNLYNKHETMRSIQQHLSKIANDLELRDIQKSESLKAQLAYVQKLIIKFSNDPGELHNLSATYNPAQKQLNSLGAIEMELIHNGTRTPQLYYAQPHAHNRAQNVLPMSASPAHAISGRGIHFDRLEPSETTALLHPTIIHTQVSISKKHWQNFWWRSYLYVASHGLGSCVLYGTARLFPPSGSVFSGPEGPKQVFNNVASQAIYGMAVITWAAVAIKVGELANRIHEIELPVKDPWAGFSKSAFTYMISSTLSMVSAGAIYQLFPKSGTLDAQPGFKQFIDNFCNGTLNNAAFIVAILFVESGYKIVEKTRRIQEGPNSNDSIPNEFRAILNEQAEDEDDAITTVLRVALGFAIGGGFTAVALVYLARWLPQSGMTGAGEGIEQVAIDIFSATLGYAVTIIGGGVVAEMLIQAINKHREHEAELAL